MSSSKIKYDELTYKDISDILERLRRVLQAKYGVGIRFSYFTTAIMALRKNESDDLDTIGD